MRKTLYCSVFNANIVLRMKYLDFTRYFLRLVFQPCDSLVNAGIETVAADDKFGRGTPSKKSKDRYDPTEG